MLRHLQARVQRSSARLSTTSTGFTRYCAKSHTWLEHTSNSTCRIGLTRRGLQDIGEATALDFSHSPVGTSRVASESAALLVDIEWEAMRISDGDELYHTTWANVSDHKLIFWPTVSGTVSRVNEALAQRIEEGTGFEVGIDDTDWLVEMCNVVVDEAFSSSLLNEADYLAAVAAQGPGRFRDDDANDDDGRLGYTSYG